jgi:DNA polymerase (family 10)
MARRKSNQEVIEILKEALAAMEVKGANRFRIRAYQNAITAIESSTFSVYDLWKSGRVHEIPGVGASLAQHINDFFEKGKVEEFEVLKNDLPEGMFELIGIQGIGAKRAYSLASTLNLEDRNTALKEVAKAAEEGKVRDIPGFGEKTEEKILDAISEMKKTKSEKPRLLWVSADKIVQRVCKYMRNNEYVDKIEALGSYRRKKETVGDIDFAVSTSNPEAVMKHFLEFPEIVEVIVEGDKKASVVVAREFQLDFRVVPPEKYGSMVQYFTGSKYHNIALRTFALEKGYSLSEYGIKDVKTDNLREFSEEEEFYNFLGLDLIPPEIRQGKDEVDLASKKALPKLVKLSDIKGDLHTHTVFSDGLNTLEEMVEAARDRGYEYVGIADHSPSVASRGYDTVKDLIAEQRLKFDKINEEYSEIEVLYGYEVNILADATLSLPNEFLDQLDFVIAGVHTSFDQDRETLMKRFNCAIENPYVDIIAHPTGRLLNERGSLDINWIDLFSVVKKYDKILEINSSPQRLDLPYDLVREAKKRGIKLIINTDAHQEAQLNLMKYGISVARRGFCESSDIVNTLSKGNFTKLIKK